MKNFFEKLFSFKKNTSSKQELPSEKELMEAKFKSALAALNLDVIIECLEAGVDANMVIDETVTEWDGGLSMEINVSFRPLDMVFNRSEAIVKLLRAKGAKTRKEIDDEKAAVSAEAYRLKRKREARETAKREKERLAKVVAYLS